MNIVFLTSESTHHYYLINEIHRSYPVKKVFFQVAHQQKNTWGNRFKTLLNPKKLSASIKEKIADALFAKERRQEARYEQDVLFKGATPFLDSSISHEKVSSFNRPEIVEKVQAQEPDIVIVFGTEILRGDILKTARKAILNIHRGIVPKYKGGGLPSWVLYNKDFDDLGITIHLCTENLDAGDIVSQAFYRLQKDDRIHTLRCQTTILATRALKEVIADFMQNKVKQVKQGPGKTWRTKDLTIGKEIIARMNLESYLRSL